MEQRRSPVQFEFSLSLRHISTHSHQKTPPEGSFSPEFSGGWRVRCWPLRTSLLPAPKRSFLSATRTLHRRSVTVVLCRNRACSTGDDLFRAAHCDQQVAANGLQVALEIQNRLEEKRSAMQPRLRLAVELARVVQSVRIELTRVEAEERQHLRTNVPAQTRETLAKRERLRRRCGAGRDPRPPRGGRCREGGGRFERARLNGRSSLGAVLLGTTNFVSDIREKTIQWNR